MTNYHQNYFRNAILLLLITLCSCQLSGQAFSRQDALTDLVYLNKAVLNGHPVNYNGKQVNLNATIEYLRSIRADSLSYPEYRFLLGRALFELGCVHTYVTKGMAPDKILPSFFPLSVIVEDDKLIIKASPAEPLSGKEISSINGIPAEKIAGEMSRFRGSDGGTEAFSLGYFNKVSPALLALYFGYPSSYLLSVGGRTMEINSSPKNIPTSVRAVEGTVIYHSGSNNFSVSQKAAILQITSFSTSLKPFFAKCLNYCRDQKITNLILDFRGNTGGNRSAAISLSRRLIDTTFSYSILQPRLKTGTYVDGKGKWFLFLSKLKYNVGSFYRSHRTSLGREFTYRYKPGKQVYKGKLYVITDGLTASSSTMVAAWLRKHTSAVFAGKQTGGGYNGNNGGAFPTLTLPKSKIQLSFPAYRLILDPHSDNAAGIKPDIETHYTAIDIAQNRDLEMEKIFQALLEEGN